MASSNTSCNRLASGSDVVALAGGQRQVDVLQPKDQAELGRGETLLDDLRAVVAIDRRIESVEDMSSMNRPGSTPRRFTKATLSPMLSMALAIMKLPEIFTAIALRGSFPKTMSSVP